MRWRLINKGKGFEVFSFSFFLFLMIVTYVYINGSMGKDKKINITR